MTVPSESHKYSQVNSNSSNVLDNSLVTPIAAVNVASPSSEGRPYLEVVAPATLPEGYSFEAEVNGETFTVKVPTGGVEEGQKFAVPFTAGSTGYSGAAIPRVSVPVGHWRDNLCDCFQHGVCHPMLCNAFFCPSILAGQILQRLRLTWTGSQGSISQTTGTFRTVLYITIGYTILHRLLQYLPAFIVPSDPYSSDEYDENRALGMVLAVVVFRFVVSLLFLIYLVTIITKARSFIRNKYSIPEKSCRGCEDCCCAFWCTCCAVSQMARHTADYDTYAGVCCSETGLPSHVPSIV